MRQKVKDGWTTPEPSQPEEAKVSPATPGKQRRCSEVPDEYEVNIGIKKYLDQHPRANIRAVAKALNVSTGKVSGMDAWQREMDRRKPAKKPPMKEPRPLTRKMLECIENEDNLADVDARIDAKDAVWQRVIEEANETERAKLHAMNAEQKRRLIEAASEHYTDLFKDGD